MARTYAALDTVNYITDPAMIADRLLADYLSTNKSQTYLYRLFSLHYTVKQSAGNMQITTAAIQQDLEDLYGRYLDNVGVTVTAEPIRDHTGAPTSLYEVMIDLNFSTPSGMRNLVQTIQQTNDSFKRIATIVKV